MNSAYRHILHTMIKKHLPITQRSQKGFTLFVSLMVASFVLAVGFSIGNIVLKQLVLSSSGGGSQIAFYAADSAAECAQFWDRKSNAGEYLPLGPFTPRVAIDSVLETSGPISCGTRADGSSGLVYNLTQVCNVACGSEAAADNVSYATTTFYVDLQSVSDVNYKACAFVTVTKKYDPTNSIEDTVIDVRGYNSELLVTANTADGCNLGRARVVERGVQVIY